MTLAGKTWIAAALLAGGVAAGGCTAATGPARPAPFPGRAGVTSPSPAAADAAFIVNRALDLRGTRYRLGGEHPDSGLDCSGLVRYVFARARIDLPRTVAGQFATGAAMESRTITAGDLLFFDTDSGDGQAGPSHVGIAIDANSFVHAPGTGSVVRVDQLSAPYWSSRLVGVRRPLRDRPLADPTF